MMRIRTIKPDFWHDEAVGAISRDLRLLYIATWNLADDEGLLRWTPDYIKAEVFRYDTDMGVAKVKKMMEQLVAGDFLFPYTAGRSNQSLAFVIRFKRHQRINRPQPSKLPPPSIQNLAVIAMYGRRDEMICHLCNECIDDVTDLRTNVYDADPDNHYHQQIKQKLSLDHLTPKSKGGTDYPSNLHAAHISCNKGRGNRDIPDSVTHSVNGARNDSVSAHGSLTAGREMEGKGNGREEEVEVDVDVERKSPSSPYAFANGEGTAAEIDDLTHRQLTNHLLHVLHFPVGYRSQARRVVTLLAAYFDARLIEEAIGYCATLRTSPRSPQYLIPVLNQWAQQRNLRIPEIRWDAAS